MLHIAPRHARNHIMFAQVLDLKAASDAVPNLSHSHEALYFFVLNQWLGSVKCAPPKR